MKKTSEVFPLQTTVLVVLISRDLGLSSNVIKQCCQVLWYMYKIIVIILKNETVVTLYITFLENSIHEDQFRSSK